MSDTMEARLAQITTTVSVSEVIGSERTVMPDFAMRAPGGGDWTGITHEEAYWFAVSLGSRRVARVVETYPGQAAEYGYLPESDAAELAAPDDAPAPLPRRPRAFRLDDRVTVANVETTDATLPEYVGHAGTVGHVRTAGEFCVIVELDGGPTMAFRPRELTLITTAEQTDDDGTVTEGYDLFGAPLPACPECGGLAGTHGFIAPPDGTPGKLSCPLNPRH